MAKRGTSKRFSVEQEDHIAGLYNGTRSPSSGGSDNDSGDVRAPADLIECKVNGRPGSPSASALVKHFTKVAEEAYAEGRSPVVALRFYVGVDHPLANPQGWLDLSVRLASEDAELRERSVQLEMVISG